VGLVDGVEGIRREGDNPAARGGGHLGNQRILGVGLRW
jgi:hypothetical protein